MLPVNVCVLELNDPKLVEPVIAEILEVIVCTTNVVAVIVPVAVRLPDVVKEPVTSTFPLLIIPFLATN